MYIKSAHLRPAYSNKQSVAALESQVHALGSQQAQHLHGLCMLLRHWGHVAAAASQAVALPAATPVSFEHVRAELAAGRGGLVLVCLVGYPVYGACSFI